MRRLWLFGFLVAAVGCGEIDPRVLALFAPAGSYGPSTIGAGGEGAAGGAADGGGGTAGGGGDQGGAGGWGATGGEGGSGGDGGTGGEACVPEPGACGGATCGSAVDSCGGEVDCGECADGDRCRSGSCCHPRACGQGWCGNVDDGCGGTLDCGATCGDGEWMTCGADGGCQCTPASAFAAGGFAEAECASRGLGHAFACGEPRDEAGNLYTDAPPGCVYQFSTIGTTDARLWCCQ